MKRRLLAASPRPEPPLPAVHAQPRALILSRPPAQRAAQGNIPQPSTALVLPTGAGVLGRATERKGWWTVIALLIGGQRGFAL